MVESVKVVKRFPDRLSIFIEPRQAVAVILADVNGVTRPVYVDRHGVPFNIGNGEGNRPSWLPVVSGIPSGTSRLGTPLPAVFAPLFEQISAICDEDPGLWQAISEVNIVRKNYGRFELVLYPVKYPVRLRMSDDINRESLRYALLMLDVFRREGSLPDEIDVRSGIGVVKEKEVRFGE
jgi:cell division protein FtsQ